MGSFIVGYRVKGFRVIGDDGVCGVWGLIWQKG